MRRSSRTGTTRYLISGLLLLSGCGAGATNDTKRATASAPNATTGSIPTTAVPAGGPLKPEESRVLGVILTGDEQLGQPVVLPASVKAGERFVLTVTTGGSGCERIGDEGVLVGEREATVMVYDFTTANRPGIACTMEFKTFRHQIPLVFSQPGEAVIRIWGRKQATTSPPYGEPYVIQRRVEVRPS